MRAPPPLEIAPLPDGSYNSAEEVRNRRGTPFAPDPPRSGGQVCAADPKEECLVSTGLFRIDLPLPALLVGVACAASHLCTPLPISAQDRAPGIDPTVGVTIGTPGIGIEGGVRPLERLGIRIGLGWIPYEYDVEEDDVIGTVSPPSPIARLTADFFPMGGAFHLSMGLHHYSGGLSGRALPQEGIELNDREYSPEEIGEFTARIWGRETAPFVGLGWQSRSGRVQPYVDMGVLLSGSPSVQVSVSGELGNDPGFRADLDAEIRELEDDLSSIRVLPHLAFGLRARLGGIP